MATRLANQRQPVRVIRSTGSTRTDRPAQPRLAGRQPGPHASSRNSRLQQPAIGMQIRSTPPPATERRAERPGPARNHTTIPSCAGVSWCLAGLSTGWPTGSVAAKPPDRGIRTGSSARAFRDGLTHLDAAAARRHAAAWDAIRRILAHWAGPASVTECDAISGPACCLPAMRAAGGADPWLPQPVLAVLVRVLDQRPGRHLLVLEQVRRLDLNRFGLAPCGKDHRFVLEHLLIDVEGCA